MLSALLLTLLPQDLEVVGRVVDAEGEPRVGVQVEAGGRAGPRRRARTGADGRFRIRLAEVPSPWLEVSAHMEGCAPEERALLTEEHGGELNVGELVLDEPGVLIGRVVDAAGEVQVGRRVYFGRRPSEDSDATGRLRRTRVDADTGEFRIEELAAGTYWVVVESSTHTFEEPATVEVPPGGEAFVELALSEIVEAEVELTVDSGGFPVELEPEHLELRTVDGDPRPVRLVLDGPPAARTARLRLPPGPHVLDVAHPRFRQRAPVRLMRGDHATLRLEPRGRVALRIRHPEGHPSPRGVGVWTYQAGDVLGVELVPARTHLPRTPLRRDLPPGKWWIEVTAEGYPPVGAVVELGQDETRTVDVRVAPVERAWVEAEDGAGRAPLSEARAWLHCGPAWLPGPWRRLSAGAGDLLPLGPLAAELQVLRLRWSPWLEVELPLEDPRGVVTIATPPAALLTPELRVPAGVDPARVELLLDPEDPPLEATTYLPPGEWTLQAAVDGGPPHAMATVELSAGETARPVVDLPAAGFHFATLRVTAGGEPLGGAHVELRSAGGTRRRIVDAEGWARLVELPPATYDMTVVADEWAWRRPAPLELEPGSIEGWRVDVPLVEREVRVLDGEGRPARRRTVFFEAGPARHGAGDRRRTDDRGMLTLALPPGRVRLGFGGATLALRWEEGEGPLVVRFGDDE